MSSIEEQLVDMQNRLLEYQLEEVKNINKLDEISERADFYEDLHNKEQKKLYEAEMKYSDLKIKTEQLEMKYSDLKIKTEQLETENKKTIEEMLKKQVDNTTSKQLIGVLWKRMQTKLIRR